MKDYRISETDWKRWINLIDDALDRYYDKVLAEAGRMPKAPGSLGERYQKLKKLVENAEELIAEVTDEQRRTSAVLANRGGPARGHRHRERTQALQPGDARRGGARQGRRQDRRVGVSKVRRTLTQTNGRANLEVWRAKRSLTALLLLNKSTIVHL